jgi:hypothetical protein
MLCTGSPRPYWQAVSQSPRALAQPVESGDPIDQTELSWNANTHDTRGKQFHPFHSMLLTKIARKDMTTSLSSGICLKIVAVDEMYFCLDFLRDCSSACPVTVARRLSPSSVGPWRAAAYLRPAAGLGRPARDPLHEYRARRTQASQPCR